MEARQPQQAHGGCSISSATTTGRCCWVSSTQRTCWSRTSAPASWSSSASAPRCCSARTLRLVLTRRDSASPGRTRRAGFAPIAEGMSGFAALQRRAGRPAAAASDGAHRRGHRDGGGIRHDGRRAQRRRPGRRRQPARVAVPDDGAVADVVRVDGRAATAPRGGPAVYGAARHLSLRRRRSGWRCRPAATRSPSG